MPELDDATRARLAHIADDDYEEADPEDWAPLTVRQAQDILRHITGLEAAQAQAAPVLAAAEAWHAATTHPDGSAAHIRATGALHDAIRAWRAARGETKNSRPRTGRE